MTTLQTILLIDDDETTNYLNHRLLTRVNAAPEIKVVTDGEQALDYLSKASKGQEGYPYPDLIFVDIKMYIMDGFEFLEKYQLLPDAQKQKAIMLMLTSSASFYDLEKLKTFPDVRQHISKPLTEGDVRDLLHEYFSSKNSHS